MLTRLESWSPEYNRTANHKLSDGELCADIYSVYGKLFVGTYRTGTPAEIVWYEANNWNTAYNALNLITSY